LKYLADMDFCDLFWCRVTLICDLLTSKVGQYMPLPVDHMCQLAPNSVHSFLKHHVHKFSNGQMDRRTDEWAP